MSEQTDAIFIFNSPRDLELAFNYEILPWVFFQARQGSTESGEKRALLQLPQGNHVDVNR